MDRRPPRTGIPAVGMQLMARVLVTEEISESGRQRLVTAGHTVDVQLGLQRDELLAAIRGADAPIG